MTTLLSAIAPYKSILIKGNKIMKSKVKTMENKKSNRDFGLVLSLSLWFLKNQMQVRPFKTDP